MTSPTADLDLHIVQRIRKLAVLAGLVGLILVAVFTQSVGGPDTRRHEGLEALGLAAIAVAIVGRAWCSLYIGGRKKAEIVTRGPYSLCRNPLYIFSFIGSFGMGAQAGSLTVGLLFLAVTVLIFSQTVRREERFLAGAFGDPYRAYMKRTPRFVPNFSLWNDEKELIVRPEFFLLTLRDGMVLLLAVPLFELIDMGQADGWLKVFAYLP
ncbi:isoprenylcysteine carboxylmethyltransferase family protein [Rhizobium sp. CRIBSB]|nr:isoprenylcysteine carboxylmethyltransferase family protein [Rhizobium sp. CRIBSB]